MVFFLAHSITLFWKIAFLLLTTCEILGINCSAFSEWFNPCSYVIGIFGVRKSIFYHVMARLQPSSVSSVSFLLSFCWRWKTHNSSFKSLIWERKLLNIVFSRSVQIGFKLILAGWLVSISEAKRLNRKASYLKCIIAGPKNIGCLPSFVVRRSLL